ncbi:hypothetical protein [Sphingopyxis sp. C-1]|jgi:cobaltochelatase CobT|uniref:cobaltochelatase CobT-related protein n=1 Tax=Sphingopyxis sp. C-1 TaxID=262667 RepID=UPI0006C278CB|nr:hypothetical protein [Sphingopyxis sp. C-1]GAO78430.1 aerobic cobaltochelatase CobT subunit [Sphingopyxis sp. C-1]
MTPGLVDIGIALAMVALIAALTVGFHRRTPQQVEDGPENELYRAYTREFDRTLSAAAVPTSLPEISPDGEKGYLEKDDRKWRLQIDRAEHNYDRLGDLGALETHEDGELSSTAVLLMVDQSGSMRGEPMAWVAAGVRRLSEELGRRGASVAVAGYSTAGWHGGFTRRKWLRDGKPSRPGRLCALLHILYQPFDNAALDPDDWRQMLNPDVLRENVDGEALEWGVNQLKSRLERRRILLVVSDGAPVDDSTLMANGPSYMHRHFLQVRDAILGAKELELMAIGAAFRVSEFYPVSRDAVDAGTLVETGLELVTRNDKYGL